MNNSKPMTARSYGRPRWIAAPLLACTLAAGPGRADPPTTPLLPQTPAPAPNAAPIEPGAQAQDTAAQAHASSDGASGPPAPPQEPPHGLQRWLNPSTAPFLPVPEIDVDPNSGTTAGLMPTFLLTNDRQEIRRIISSTIDYNPNFGVGLGGSVYAYPSEDTQWSATGGAQRYLQRGFDYEYIAGRQRDTAWSFDASVVFDRSGTPRFYGIGNSSPVYDETNYTLSQKYVQSLIGYNIDHNWQIAWVFRARDVDVEPGTLEDIVSLTRRFADILGVGVTHETLNRFEIIYDTRDDIFIPTRGGEYVIYGGAAGRTGVLDSSLYSATGIDARQLFPLHEGSILAAHVALRYMPGVENVPFWSLSEIGGERSVIGEEQPLRGFGEGRFYGRNSFASNFELRQRVLTMDAISTHINVEVTPFLDMGEVFAHSREIPFTQLHKVVGVGFRGIASPFIVGFVDVGYGSEGAAVFTGINYPF